MTETETPGAGDEPREPTTPTTEAPEGNSCRACGMSCLGLVILIAILTGFLSSNASATLDARYARAAEQIVAQQKSADVRRSTVLGQPHNDENALPDYNGLQWALSGGDVEEMRPSWKLQRPELPVDIEEMTAKVAPDGKGIDVSMSGTLLRGIDPEHLPGGELSPRDQKQLDDAKKIYEQVKPALRYVRDGLKRGRANWKAQWEKGMRLDIPNLLQMRAAANFMAYEASLQDPKAGLQTGLEIVAFGEDNARQGSLIGAMIGIAITQIGFKSLAHTLGRPGLDADDYRHVIEVLATYEPPRTALLLECEQLGAVVSLLEMSGRRLDQSEKEGLEMGLGEGIGLKALAELDFFHARELEGYETFMGRAIEVSRLPRAERKGAGEALSRELEDSYYLIANQAIPNLSGVTDQVAHIIGMSRAARVLASAHLHRLEQGSFPNVIEDLAGLLGKEIEDPTANRAGAPLGYEVEGEVLRCWIAGENGVDDGGPEKKVYQGKKTKKKKKKKKGPPSRFTDDRGLQTRVPAPK